LQVLSDSTAVALLVQTFHARDFIGRLTGLSRPATAERTGSSGVGFFLPRRLLHAPARTNRLKLVRPVACPDARAARRKLVARPLRWRGRGRAAYRLAQPSKRAGAFAAHPWRATHSGRRTAWTRAGRFCAPTRKPIGRRSSAAARAWVQPF